MVSSLGLQQCNVPGEYVLTDWQYKIQYTGQKLQPKV